MARIRTIKPEFFKHEELFDAERESGHPLRLAFAGLWTACDREGRFEWKPRTLKTDIMPYDEVDFAAILDALVSHGFVARYRVGGKDYGHIPGFTRHQVINTRESASKLPSPDEADETPPEPTRRAPVADASPTRHDLAHGEGKGREGEREGSVDASASTGAAGADGVVDFAKATFDLGVRVIMAAGYSERAARSFIGKCRKEAGDAETFAALREASGKTEPVAWLVERLKPKPAQPDIDTLMAQALGGRQ